MYHHNQINTDHELLMLELHPSELEITKACAYKVKTHLEKLSESRPNYLTNLTIVNGIISQYEKALRLGINSRSLN